MATTGTRIVCNTTQLCGGAVLCGQGLDPELWALYSTDDASVNVPTWLDATADLRSFSSSRGTEGEFVEIDAGTCTLVLGARHRTYDPAINALIRPLNRWWLREQFTGETQDIFKGYAESYEQSWPGGGWSDAETTVTCADEFKVLALATLPTTSPPRDTYADVVAFDDPAGYWAMDDSATTKAETGNPGPPLVLQTSSMSSVAGAGAIVGQEPAGNLQLQHGNYLASEGLNQGDAGDVTGLSEFTIEGWFQVDTPSVTQNLLVGPTAGAASTWRLYVTGSTFTLEARNSAGTNASIASGTIVANTWYHVVGTIEAGTLKLYLNGGLVASSAWSGSFNATLDAGAALICGPNVGSGSELANFDEVAFWRRSLTAVTVGLHYAAGSGRGFARGQLPNARVAAVLDSITSHAPRSVRTGTRTMTGAYMTGQAPLDELRNARVAENVDAMLFVARDGTVTFLDAGHRSVSPWNTVQATFDDDGTDLPYLDLADDYSDSFLTNQWDVTATNGLVQTATDLASIGSFFKRPLSLTDIPVVNDTHAANIAAALLAKTKQPFTRITQITLTTDMPDVTEAVFRRDLGDRIRVLRTPPGGGARFDQTLVIRKIEVGGDNDPRAAWRIVWGLSPL